MKKGDLVLGRCSQEDIWTLGIFDEVDGDIFRCLHRNYTECIPYLYNEYLHGTSSMPVKYEIGFRCFMPPNESISAEIQKSLFKLGAIWFQLGNSIADTDGHFIFVKKLSDNVYRIWKRSAWSISRDTVIYHTNPEKIKLSEDCFFKYNPDSNNTELFCDGYFYEMSNPKDLLESF